jgi:hypothetical protein
MKINKSLNKIFGDPEDDKVPNIVIQIRKSMDLNGNFPIKFQDGNSEHISLNMMTDFLNKYQSLKPARREDMQKQAIQSFDAFKDAMKNF